MVLGTKKGSTLFPGQGPFSSLSWEFTENQLHDFDVRGTLRVRAGGSILVEGDGAIAWEDGSSYVDPDGMFLYSPPTTAGDSITWSNGYSIATYTSVEGAGHLIINYAGAYHRAAIELASGTNPSNAGDITLTAEENGTVFSQVLIGGGRVVRVAAGFLALGMDVASGGPVELTINTGAITVTDSYHRIDTQADAASDDLDTISATGSGAILVLKAENTARSVVLKDGTGNLKLAGDCTLDNTEDTIVLFYDGSNWLELCRSNNGA